MHLVGIPLFGIPIRINHYGTTTADHFDDQAPQDVTETRVNFPNKYTWGDFLKPSS